MSSFHEQVALGRSGIKVGRLGFGASYAAPAASYEKAFERGCNYFYWGSRRREMMATAIRNIARTKREELVVVVQSYARFGWMLKRSVRRANKDLGIAVADVLLLGWHNQPPAARIVDAALELKEKGEVGCIAISGHRRTMFPELYADARYDIWHTRYNAVHRGAEREVFPTLEGCATAERPGVVTYTTTRWGHLCDPARTPDGENTPTGTDCYRFALSAPHVDVALAGPASEEQMDQALRALDLGPMDEDELAWMCRVGDHIYGRDSSSGVRDAV
jgi:aryl-alcohol dehydrogenase-like predicted oxidoreductase